MKKIISVIASTFLMMFIFACNNNDTKTSVPDKKNQPEASAIDLSQSAVFKLNATGYQIYKCSIDSSGKYVWNFLAPDADLLDETGNAVGHHYAGPTWELYKGHSTIKGKKITDADAPDQNDIKWLVLGVEVPGGSGLFAGVNRILRVETKGGKAPSDPLTSADLDRLDSVRYTATYYFFKKKNN